MLGVPQSADDVSDADAAATVLTGVLSVGAIVALRESIRRFMTRGTEKHGGMTPNASGSLELTPHRAEIVRRLSEPLGRVAQTMLTS